MGSLIRTKQVVHVTDLMAEQVTPSPFPAVSFGYRTDGTAPIQNKVGAFLADPLLNRIRRIMYQGQVLLVNLAKGPQRAHGANSFIPKRLGDVPCEIHHRRISGAHRGVSLPVVPGVGAAFRGGLTCEGTFCCSRHLLSFWHMALLRLPRGR
jgi:hypothetical protein